MVTTVTKTAHRSKKGPDWEAFFFKHRNNTVMVEDLWDAIDPGLDAEEIISTLNQIAVGHNKIKVTAQVTQTMNDLVEVIRDGNTLPSITLNIKR